jgi:ABC-2 type transport system permease protein
MKLRRVWSISKKSLREVRRDRGRFFFTLVFPLMFLFMFGLAFGGNHTTSYNVGVVNMGISNIDAQCARQFVGNLTYGGIIQVNEYGSDNTTALGDLREGKLSGVVVIPSNFGESILSFWMSPSSPSEWTNTSVLLYADGGSIFASQTIPPLVQQALVKTAFGSETTGSSLPVTVSSPTLVSVEGLRILDSMVPSMMVFAIFLAMQTTATASIEEKEKGLARRIRTTPATASDVLAGATVAAMIVAVFQVAVMFGASFLIGYSPKGGAYGLMSGFLVAMIFAVTCVGLGLIIGSVSKTEGAAAAISWVIMMPLMFFSGLWVPKEMLPSQVQPLSDVLPTTRIADALTSLLSRGAAITAPAVLIDIIGISAFTAAVYIIGILVSRRSAAYF